MKYKSKYVLSIVAEKPPRTRKIQKRHRVKHPFRISTRIFLVRVTFLLRPRRGYVLIYPSYVCCLFMNIQQQPTLKELSRKRNAHPPPAVRPRTSFAWLKRKKPETALSRNMYTYSSCAGRQYNMSIIQASCDV